MLAPMAAHAAVMCGQTITSSMTLDQDLTCSGNGIFINADNVVLDLAGHTVTGPTPTTTGSGPRGVIALQNRTGIVIRNGTIRRFDSGVDVAPGVSASTLTGLTLDANATGVRINTGASTIHVSADTITNTTRFSAIQMGGNGHVVEDNTMSNGNGAGVFLSGNDNVIRNNRISDMGTNGILISSFPTNPGPFTNNQVVGNIISGSARLFNSSSISVNRGSGTLIQGNEVNGRGSSPGVFLIDSADTVVTRNSLTNNSSGALVRGSSSGTRLSGNRADQNVFAGLAVESQPTGTLIADNTAAANGGNGIDVKSPSATVARNTAAYNSGFGIFAVNGVTDGGGNRAFGNGQPAQCTPNIAC